MLLEDPTREQSIEHVIVFQSSLKILLTTKQMYSTPNKDAELRM